MCRLIFNKKKIGVNKLLSCINCYTTPAFTAILPDSLMEEYKQYRLTVLEQASGNCQGVQMVYGNVCDEVDIRLMKLNVEMSKNTKNRKKGRL